MCWATEDREHVIMKEIVGGVLQRAHELHVKTGIRLSRTESVKNIGNNNSVCDQVCSKLNYGLIIINVTTINVFNNCYWLHH